MTDPVIRVAINLRDRLRETERELRILASTATHPATRTMRGFDADSCRDAALMLEKLGTEVTRLRLGVGHFFYGWMSRVDLGRMARCWNSDPDPQPRVETPAVAAARQVLAQKVEFDRTLAGIRGDSSGQGGAFLESQAVVWASRAAALATAITEPESTS